jgi:hypothetical protein
LRRRDEEYGYDGEEDGEEDDEENGGDDCKEP